MTSFPASRADEYISAISNLGFQPPSHQISSTYTDGILGEAVIGRSGAAVIVGDLVELSGCFDQAVYNRISKIDEAHLVEPPQCWIDGIASTGPDRFSPYKRQAFVPMRPGQIGWTVNLDPVILRTEGAPVEIAPIDDTDKKTLLEDAWSADIVANTISIGPPFPSPFGFIARLNDRVIGGVGCYAVYASGVEIQIDTRDGYRRRGVATELAKRMLIECRNRSLECHWDAMNPESAALARKLGFVSGRTYRCYELSVHGRR